jgi:hypothetical protein
VAQGFAHTFDAIERADVGEYVGRISTLSPPSLPQPAGLESFQQGVEQLLLSLVEQNAVAKVVEQGVVKARVGQLEAEQVLPVEATSHIVGGLTIGEAFKLLEHEDKGQTPGCHLNRGAEGRKPVGEQRISEKGAEFLAQADVAVAIGKSSNVAAAVASGTGGTGCAWKLIVTPPVC